MIIIIITNLISDIYCATSSDRIVFPDEAAEWDKYNAIQAQAAGVVEPVYRQQNSIPTTKDYEFITQFTLNLFKVYVYIDKHFYQRVKKIISSFTQGIKTKYSNRKSCAMPNISCIIIISITIGSN